MPKIIKETGNIVDYIGEVDAIAHGCNCFGTMGSGVAKVLDDFTNGWLLKADIINTEHGDINKMGSFTWIPFGGSRIYNLYTQYGFGSGIHVDWPSVTKAISKMCDHLGPRCTVAIPLIGCGLGGGSKDDLMDALASIPSRATIVVVEYDQ